MTPEERELLEFAFFLMPFVAVILTCNWLDP